MHGQLPRPHAPKGVVPQDIGLPRFKRIILGCPSPPLPLEVHGRLRSEFDGGRAILLRGCVTEIERTREGFRLTMLTTSVSP